MERSKQSIPLNNVKYPLPQLQTRTSLPQRIESGGDVSNWHLADKSTAPEFVAYWTNNGQWATTARSGMTVVAPNFLEAILVLPYSNA